MARQGRRSGEVGDVIAEIETDKATMEVEAVDEGTVAKLVVPAGTEGVKVNTVIAILAADGEDASVAANGGDAGKASVTPKAEALKDEKGATPSSPLGGGVAEATEGGGAAGPPRPAVRPPGAARRPSPQGEGDSRPFASPLARRIAKGRRGRRRRPVRHRPARPRGQGRRRGGDLRRWRKGRSRRQACSGCCSFSSRTGPQNPCPTRPC